MIKKLFEMNSFNYHTFIFENTKALSLGLTDAFVLIRMIDLYKENDIYDREKFNNLNIKRNDLDNSLIKLQEKGFYNLFLKTIDSKDYEAFNIDGFFEKVESILESKPILNTDSELNSIVNIVKEALNKILTPTELDIIKSFVDDDRYTKEDFVKAIEIIKTKNRMPSIKTLGTALEYIRKNNIEVKSEAPNVLNDFINRMR